jgi:hypothetical protein
MEKVPDPSSRSIQPVVTIVSIHERHNDFAYWQSQPYFLRVAALEELRSMYSVRNSEGGYIALTPDYKEFIQSLNENSVRYLVVGGYAVAIHGHPRFTKDLDIWIDRSVENAKRIVRALEQFGFASLGLQEGDFLVEDQIVQLDYPLNRIDLITNLEGVTFGDSFEKRVQGTIEGVEINFIDLDNLRKNKKATGRLQDLADLEKLE